jgi:vancomycin resistance protein VanJ
VRRFKRKIDDTIRPAPIQGVGLSHVKTHLILLLTGSNLAGILLVFLLGEYVAERTWLTTLLAYAPPLLFALPTAVLFLVVLNRRRQAELIFGAAAALFCWFVLLGFRAPLAPAPEGPRLRVLTYNIAHGSAGVGRIAAVVRRYRPDVICFEEVNGFQSLPDPLPALQKALFDYRFVRGGEVTLATRLPVRSVATHPLITGGAYRVAVETAVEYKGRVVTVLGVHLATSATPESLTDRRGSIPAYLRRTTGVRESQIARLEEITARIDTPLVVCGDFNTPPRGHLYRRLTETYEDAFAARGTGFGWTYPATLPALRIDYIFTTGGAHAASALVPAVFASDHRPLFAEIVLPKATPRR